MTSKSPLIFFVLGIFLFFLSICSKTSADEFATIAAGAICIIGSIGQYFYLNKKENEESNAKNKIKMEYENALKGKDKAEALRLGRIYYSSQREDKRLTIYDEQAISNDLNSMK